jgi:ketol-acid reductoisomerase
MTSIDSSLFSPLEIDLAGSVEPVLAGGRHLFHLLPRAFARISRIGVIGWGPQGRAQALNLRDSLASTDITVAVGLRAGSTSFAAARAEGFSEADGTLGEMFEVIRDSDLVVLLIADAALAALADEVFAALKPNAIIGLSHGYLLAHLHTAGRSFPANVSVIAVCPKGMGRSVRRLYEQGRNTEGAGINASIAVHADVDGRASDVALGWAVALGAPYIFRTTLDDEFRSDIVGERAILLAIPHAIAEAMYRRGIELGDTPNSAFVRSTESMTGPLARAVSRGGLRAVLDTLNDGDARRTFDHAYCATYHAFLPLLVELYDEVASGLELESVQRATARLGEYPMATLDGSRMWAVGDEVRGLRGRSEVELDSSTAGIFCGAMVAQIDVLRERGHTWSEIANESVIELVDSLIPYMHARGIAHMVDNCSTTARLGARRWEPRFEAALNQQVFARLDGDGDYDADLVVAFENHPIHDVLATIGQFRPTVDVAAV